MMLRMVPTRWIRADKWQCQMVTHMTALHTEFVILILFTHKLTRVPVSDPRLGGQSSRQGC